MTEKLYCDSKEIGVPKIQFIKEQESFWKAYKEIVKDIPDIHTYPDGAIFVERKDIDEPNDYEEFLTLKVGDKEVRVKRLTEPSGGANLTVAQVEEIFRYAFYFLEKLAAKPNNSNAYGRCCYGAIPFLKC